MLGEDQQCEPAWKTGSGTTLKLRIGTPKGPGALAAPDVPSRRSRTLRSGKARVFVARGPGGTGGGPDHGETSDLMPWPLRSAEQSLGPVAGALLEYVLAGIAEPFSS